MKRKIVLHGQSTLTVSLPAKWAKKFKIGKGDELDIEERGKELRINFRDENRFEKKQIKIQGFKRVGKSEVTSSYRQGYDEVNLEYDDTKYAETIRNLISQEMIGFEIIKQGKDYCVIKDLTGHSKDEFETALKRVWMLTLDLANESLDALKKQDSERLRGIKEMDRAINKFSNYCLRLLVKKGHADFQKTPLYYHLIKCLEEIADQYKDICALYYDEKKAGDKLLSMFAEINNYLQETYKLFYKYDKQTTEELLSKTKQTYNEMPLSKDNAFFYLLSICKDIRNLSSVLIEINM